jgi:putative FmdB family regulatory protein
LPIYEYQCRKCGAVTDVRHGFDETVSQPCPKCGGELARVFSAAPVVFKGSGFYKTDSRKSVGSTSSSSGSSTSTPAASTSSEPASTEKATEKKSDAPKGAGEAA